jgi:hypothetical protein
MFKTRKRGEKTMVGQSNAVESYAQRLSRRKQGSLQFSVGAGFALIYALMQYYAALSSLSVLALLPCILWRLDERKRKIGQAPLTFATLMLTQKVFTTQAGGALRGMFGVQLAAPWLPLFLAVCLFYMPEGTSYSRKAFIGLGVVVLSSGLLPGSGFAAIFLVLEYLLPVAVAVAIGMDFFGSSKSWEHG